MKKFIILILTLSFFSTIILGASAETLLNASDEEIIYGENEAIQEFLVLFNELYPDNVITSDMLTKYYHHGSEHDDQVKIQLNGYTVLLSDDTWLSSTDEYDLRINIDNVDTNNETIKELFFIFMKVFDQSLSDETLEIFWEQHIDGGYSNIDSLGDIDCYTTVGMTGIVQYTEIEGTIVNRNYE